MMWMLSEFVYIQPHRRTPDTLNRGPKASVDQTCWIPTTICISVREPEPSTVSSRFSLAFSPMLISLLFAHEIESKYLVLSVSCVASTTAENTMHYSRHGLLLGGTGRPIARLRVSAYQWRLHGDIDVQCA